MSKSNKRKKSNGDPLKADIQIQSPIHRETTGRKPRGRDNTQTETGNEEEFLDANSELFYTVDNGKSQSTFSKDMANPKHYHSFKGYQEEKKGDQALQSKTVSKKTKSNNSKDPKKSKKEVEEVAEKPKKTVFEIINKTKFTFESTGIQLLFINDYDQVFCPVLDIDIPDIIYRSTSDEQETSMQEFELQKTRIFTFNSIIGDWEPFVENFGIKALFNSVKLQKFMKIEIAKQVVVNVTECCLQNLIETYNSWMMTPPFQLDEDGYFTSYLQDQTKTIKDNQNSGSNVSSINDEKEDIFDVKNNRSNKLKKRTTGSFSGMAHDFNDIDKVTPYSIKNLSHMKLTVSNGALPNQFNLQLNQHNQSENNTSWDRNNACSESEKPDGASFIASEIFSSNSKIYKLKPLEECQYAVEYDQQARYLMVNNTKSKKTQNMDNPFSQASIHSEKQKQGSSLKTKAQEIVSVIIENGDEVHTIQNVDLNEIQTKFFILKKQQARGKTNQQQEEEKQENYRNSSKLDISIEEDFMKHYGNKQVKKDTKNKQSSEGDVIESIDQHYLVYGVTMMKMRKLLTIRTPFTIYNNTLFDFMLKITDRSSQVLKEEVLLRSEKRFPIDFAYYFNHNLQIQIQNRKLALNSCDEDESYSKIAYLENLRNLNLNSGFLMNHNQNFYTFVKLSPSNLQYAYDITLLPPVVVRNALPCYMEVLGNNVFQGAKQSSDIEGKSFQMEKGQEKHFHIFNYNGENKDEIAIKFRISGYSWSLLNLKTTKQVKSALSNFNQHSQKSQENSFVEDRDINIMDLNGNNLQICVRIKQIHAAFHCTFYAHTCVINHSHYRMTFYYDLMNKVPIAGQEGFKNFFLANKDLSILACLNDRFFSKSIKIRNAGVREQFSILQQYQHLSSNKKEKSVKPNEEENVISKQRQKKLDFSFSTYLSLAIEDDFIYTKIVQISPKYVVVNKTKSGLIICQEGLENDSKLHESITANERKEWVWADAAGVELLRVKRQNYNPEQMFMADLASSLLELSDTEKNKQWEWSSSFSINDIGTVSLQIKKKGVLENTLRSRKLIRVNKKIIDSTTFVIFEDEGKDSYYRIENGTKQFEISIVQKGFNINREGFELLPNKDMPFAFVDPKEPHILSCQIMYVDMDKVGSQELQTHEVQVFDREYQIDEMGQKEIIKYIYSTRHGAQQTRELHVNIFTNGCTKILRFSDMSLQDEQRIKDDKDHNKSNKEKNKEMIIMAQTTILEVAIKELGFSIVSPVTVKKKGKFITKRKEIAYITIGDIQFTDYSSKKWQHTKLRIGLLQIDNQSNVNALFPTILQPRVFKSMKNNQQYTFLEVQLFMNLDQPSVSYVDEMEVNVQGIIIKLDDEFLGYALNFTYDILELMKTNLTGIHPIFMQDQSFQSSYEALHGNDEDKDFGDDRFTYYPNKDKIFIEGFGQKDLNINRKESAHREAFQGVAIPKDKRKKNSQKRFKDSQNKTVQNLQQSEGKIQEVDMQVKKSKAEPIVDQKYMNWYNQILEDSSKKLYINNCKMSGLDLEVSFLARKKFQLGQKEDALQLRKYMNSSGLALINIDEAPITLSSLELSQMFGASADVIQIVSEHYTSQLKKNVFTLIGSTSLLGNPRKFVATLNRGVSDFIKEPGNGYRQGGVKEMGKGVAKGTGSLMKNTVEGAFGSFQAINESISKGLLILSQDKGYMCKREEKLLTEKPKNFVEGVGFGCKTAINSLGSGIKGIVFRPYKEAKRGGIKGFAYGLYSGSSGVILKPFSGGLDLIAKSMEGVKNTAKIFDAKVFKDRQRLPRVFYGHQQQIRVYSDSDSYIVMRILTSIKEKLFRKDHYIETVKFELGERTLFLIITEEHIILLEAAQKSVWWHIQSDLIAVIEKYKNGLILNLKQKFEGRRHVAIEIDNQNLIDKVYDKIKGLASDVVEV